MMILGMKKGLRTVLLSVGLFGVVSVSSSAQSFLAGEVIIVANNDVSTFSDNARSNSSVSPSRSLDQVVAVVNNEAITLSEYVARHQREFLGGDEAVKYAYETGVIDREVLQRLINDRIIIQSALRRGVQVSDAEVAAAVQSVAGSNKLTVAELYTKIEQDGLSARDFRESIKEQIIRRRIIDIEINSKIEISDEEVEEFIQEQDIEMPQVAQEGYEILQILFSTDGKDEQTVDVMKKKIDDLMAGVNSLEDFANLANQYSVASDGKDGGYIGWRSKDELPELFADILSEMSVGRVSKKFTSENGIHVLYLKDKQSAPLNQNVVQQNMSHILIRGAGFKGRNDNEAFELASNVYQQIQDGQSFESMARIYSEDMRTNEKNGLLGWVDETQMARSILDEVAQVAVGEIAPPIQSPAGWHIIRLNDLRELSTQAIMLNNRARSILFRQKASEEFDQWFEQLKDNSFVEIVDGR